MLSSYAPAFHDANRIHSALVSFAEAPEPCQNVRVEAHRRGFFQGPGWTVQAGIEFGHVRQIDLVVRKFIQGGEHGLLLGRQRRRIVKVDLERYCTFFSHFSWPFVLK